MSGSRVAAALALMLCAASLAGAQSATSAVPEPYAAAEFPQWALDLRRGEIVAFGALPFTLFFSTFAMDAYRSSRNDWDRRYAPWPFKSAGAVSMTEDEFKATFAAACVGAVVVALVDLAIVSVKRHGARKAVAERPKAAIRVERSPATPLVVPAEEMPAPESP